MWGGVNIGNNEVMQRLRGPSGTKVKISISRSGHKNLLEYTITRSKIPIFSIDVSYMADSITGYIKISRFAANTYTEYLEAFHKLKKSGMKNLIIDLRGNPGGYLSAAISLADEYLDNKKIIVYTEGKAHARENYFATDKGEFKTGKLVVMVDEGSASASEIIAGALQDWDRATIIGRRSFGKGLVQEQSQFPDGSAVRLTIARYYTPTGRCIQKPYNSGIQDYNSELYERYRHGELENADSIKFSDSLKFRTPGGKVVYGGGGIMPDIFVPLDTLSNTAFLTSVYRSGLISSYCYEYVDKHRKDLLKYGSPENFKTEFQVENPIYKEFLLYAVKNKINYSERELKISSSVLKLQLKAYIGRLLWKEEGYFPVINAYDKAYLKALEWLNQ